MCSRFLQTAGPSLEPCGAVTQDPVLRRTPLGSVLSCHPFGIHYNFCFLVSSFTNYKAGPVPLQDTHGGPAKITLKNEVCHNRESTPTLSSLKTGVPHLLESDDKNPKEEPMGHCCFLFKCLSEP